MPDLVFTDQAVAGAWLAETFGRWADALPPPEHEAIADYKGEEYREVNSALRREAPLSDREAGQLALLDRALARFELPEPVFVFRGLHLAGRTIIGAEIEDPACFSRSLLERHAQGFLRLPAEQPFSPGLARVRLPAGTKCGAPDLVEYLGEVEILLPRRSRFIIRAARPPDRDRPYWAVDLEAVL